MINIQYRLFQLRKQTLIITRANATIKDMKLSIRKCKMKVFTVEMTTLSFCVENAQQTEYIKWSEICYLRNDVKYGRIGDCPKQRRRMDIEWHRFQGWLWMPEFVCVWAFERETNLRWASDCVCFPQKIPFDRRLVNTALLLKSSIQMGPGVALKRPSIATTFLRKHWIGSIKQFPCNRLLNSFFKPPRSFKSNSKSTGFLSAPTPQASFKWCKARNGSTHTWSP